MKMKFLVVSQHFWPENFRINDLVNDFCARGYQITVLTGLPNYPEGNFFSGYSMKGPWTQEQAGAKIVRVPLIARGKAGVLRLILNHLSFLIFGFIAMLFRIHGR